MMMIKNKIITSLLLGAIFIFSSSCNNEPDCCVNVDVEVRIHYQTPTGANLLNSSGEYQESNIKIFYKNGSAFEYINRGNLDLPNMFDVSEDEKGNRILGVFPSDFYEGNESTTLIQLNEHIVDTLVCHFDLGNNNIICKQAWLNGVEMKNRFIEVKK